MIYVIMCGGQYDDFKEHKALSVVNGERLADRTIRLLREAGADQTCIFISSNDSRFDECGVTRLKHENSYHVEFSAAGKQIKGYWLDAFYPYFTESDKVTYLFGDVYYTPAAISRIVNYKTDKNVLFGTSAAKNEFNKNWGEPFAYVVNDYAQFMHGIDAVKKLQNEGKLKRVALVWELYRFLNGLDVNVQTVREETYVCIDDETMDIDAPWQIETMKEKVKQ